MLVEKIYILGALLKLPFFTHDEEMKNWANSYLTFHSWSPITNNNDLNYISSTYL